jgi:hypothetical protein
MPASNYGRGAWGVGRGAWGVGRGPRHAALSICSLASYRYVT